MPPTTCLSHRFSACLFGVPQVRCPQQREAPVCMSSSGREPVYQGSLVVYRLWYDGARLSAVQVYSGAPHLTLAPYTPFSVERSNAT
jgi:hypothetical protein